MVEDLMLTKYSVNFSTSLNSNDAFNTWTDWHLIPTSRPSITIPQIVTRFTELPISDYQIDETDAFSLTNYQAISGEWEFYIPPEYMKDWPNVYSNLLEYLHGRARYVWLEDDDSVAYLLRCAINGMEHKSDGSGTNFKIGYNGNPTFYDR